MRAGLQVGVTTVDDCGESDACFVQRGVASCEFVMWTVVQSGDNT